MQATDEEAVASMDWGREGEVGEGGSGGGGGGTAGAALPATGQPDKAGTEEVGMGASASGAMLPASVTKQPTGSNAENEASAAAAAAAAGEQGGEAEQLADAEPDADQQLQQAQHRHRKRWQEGEGAADAPAHHGGASWRQIDAEAWSQHVAIVGGSVLLGELQLCAMQVGGVVAAECVAER